MKLALVLLAACFTEHPRDDVRQTPGMQFVTLDRNLNLYRAAMCEELGREIPDLEHPHAPIEDPATDCEAGDAVACFTVGTVAESARDFGRAHAAYRRSCDGGDRNGCLWLNSLLRTAHARVERFALVRDVCAKRRPDLCSLLYRDLDVTERAAFGDGALAEIKRDMEGACQPGHGDACEARAELDCAYGVDCEKPLQPWRLRACRFGVAAACQAALPTFAGDDLVRAQDAFRRACPHGRCRGVVAALTEGCRDGSATSCYLAVNACTHGGAAAYPPPGETATVDPHGREVFDRFTDLDQSLTTLRDDLCKELGRAVPVAPPAPSRPALPRDERDAACDRGDTHACLWRAIVAQSGIDSDAQGKRIFVRKDLARARADFTRSCDGGEDFACLALSSLLHDQHDAAGHVALVHRVCMADRLELCAKLWASLNIDERRRFGRSAFTLLRDSLEVACKPGAGEMCEARARLECDPGYECPSDTAPPWFETACRNGSGTACLDVKLDLATVRRTAGVIARACKPSGCVGLAATLAASCRDGVTTSCYLRANACTRPAQFAPQDAGNHWR